MRFRGSAVPVLVIGILLGVVAAAFGQDGTGSGGFSLDALLEGADLKLMGAIAFISLLIERNDWLPPKIETLVPLVLGAVWGVGATLLAGAESNAALAAQIFRNSIINAAVAQVAVYYVNPLLPKQLFGGATQS